MFEKFFDYANIDGDDSLTDPAAFLKKYSGYTFNRGIYRIHDVNDIPKWTGIVENAFPEYKGSIQVFAYDWLGRQFAIKKQTGTILLFEPGTGEVLNIPADFVEFHDVEIAEYSEDSLASGFFDEWINSEAGCDIPHNKCVGYKVPLFLNGEDNLDNLELSDMEVYWGVIGNMR